MQAVLDQDREKATKKLLDSASLATAQLLPSRGWRRARLVVRGVGDAGGQFGLGRGAGHSQRCDERKSTYVVAFAPDLLVSPK